MLTYRPASGLWQLTSFGRERTSSSIIVAQCGLSLNPRSMPVSSTSSPTRMIRATLSPVEHVRPKRRHLVIDLVIYRTGLIFYACVSECPLSRNASNFAAFNTLTARAHGVDTSPIARAHGVDVDIYKLIRCLTPWG